MRITHLWEARNADRVVDPHSVRRVLLASEGRQFSDAAVDLAATLAERRAGRVRVVTIARLWGSGLGLPYPGLRPNKHEMTEHEENIAAAIRRLRRMGVHADGHIITTRRPCASILHEAKRQNSGVIVMAADPRHVWLIRDFMWSQEPYRIQRRAAVPVRLVVESASCDTPAAMS